MITSRTPKISRILNDYQSYLKENVLNLQSQGLHDADIPALSEFLNQHPEITKLNIGYNSIGDEGAKVLAANTHITNLDIRWNNIGAEGVKALAANTHITNLDISNNNIGDEGAKAFLNNSKLVDIHFTGNGVDS